MDTKGGAVGNVSINEDSYTIFIFMIFSAFEVGTFVLKIEVYRFSSNSTNAQLYGTALYQPSNLVPGTSLVL